VYVDTRPTGYKLSADLVEEAITAATKAIIINSPNNPTELFMTLRRFLRIAEVALERKRSGLSSTSAIRSW
jgi:aspartate/methionine/tyrosine aminotransferase